MPNKRTLNQSLYLKCLAWFFAAVWLLPNHYPPWGAFHNDAYAAVVLLATAGVVLSARPPGPMAWHWATVAVVVCALLPMLQLLFGQILWLGTAWINSAYLLGLACALSLGAVWEKRAPGGCGDFLFAGIVPAGILSMVISLTQWLGLGVSDLWVLKTDGRPFANLGQPNQAASLYLLAIIGCAWFYSRKKISGKFAIFLHILLLIGLAITASRTGHVNAVFVAIGLLWWSFKSKDKRWAIATIFSLAILAVLIVTLPSLSDLLELRRPIDWASRTVMNGRSEVWQLMLDASTQHPLLGYGWGQTSVASLNAVANHPRLDAITDHSHNLFLDLVIWNGIVLGGAICAGLIAWMGLIAIRLKSLSELLLLLCLCVLAFHAMTEFPLHYAYFLLPAGMIAGILNDRLNVQLAFTSGRKPMVILMIVAAVMLGITIRDYLRVESSFTDLRFEKIGVKLRQAGKPPDIWVLTNLRAAVIMGRWKPTTGMSEQDLLKMSAVAVTYPSTNNIYTMAVAYGLNDQKEKASRWLEIGCKTGPEQICQGLKYQWTHDDRLIGFPWPGF